MTSTTSGQRGALDTFLDALDGSYCTNSAFNQTGDCKDASLLDPIYYPNPFANASIPATDKYEDARQCGLYDPIGLADRRCETKRNKTGCASGNLQGRHDWIESRLQFVWVPGSNSPWFIIRTGHGRF
ncbi:hypothetical protein QBC45DRAFT_392251 [Copromyces sp. CBS 386.78]|nr:hypothetical protein QBC45DRAFT_392251 [Copromyces sp. CBS 386.78]